MPSVLAARPGRLHTAALTAAAAGLHVFPVWPFGKTPAVEDWEHAATCDAAQIAAWWEQRPWNIGVATGPSGLLVIDLDTSSDPPSPRWAGARGGRDVLARLAAAAGQPLPTDTHTVATPSGGEHLYFRQPPELALRNTQGGHGTGLGWCIDTRGHGGFVVAAGSRARRPAAGRVEVAATGYYRVSRHLEIAVLPTWIAAALTPPPPLAPSSTPASAPAGARSVSATRARAYVDTVAAHQAAQVRAAAVGDRHTTLLTAALKLGNWVGGGLLDEAAAVAALTAAAAHYIGVDGYTARKVATTIADGLAYGAARPRTADTIPDRAP